MKEENVHDRETWQSKHRKLGIPLESQGKRE